MKNYEWLLGYRKEHGLTQWEMAKKLKVSMASYRMWEKGVTKPTEENMKKLDQLLEEGYF